MIRHFVILLILLQLSAFVSAAGCAGYSEKFDVRVLDGNLRPLEGADVIVRYDRGSTFGEQYFITPVQKTDSSGMVHFEIFNQGTTSRKIDCNIYINASISGAKGTVTAIAQQHGPIVDVKFSDVFPLRFYVRDQLRAPLVNASVNVGNRTEKTDQLGMARYYFKKGTYDYLANYYDGVQSGKLNITNDTEFEVIFSYYKISIDVTDDSGVPLNATLTIANRTSVMENGHYENPKIFGESVPYRLEYSGLMSNGTITPDDPIVMIRYDISSPSFVSIDPRLVNGKYRLIIDVTDPNKYASGVDVTSIKATYKIEPSDITTPWSSAIVFATAINQFSADFPQLPPGSLVKFRIEIKDKAGNRAEKEGKFATAGVKPPINDTKNQTNTQPEEPKDQGIPLIYIIGSVILLVLAVYLVIRIISKPMGAS